MADVQPGDQASGDDVGSQETKPTETVPKTQSLLRPSAFSVPVTTTAAVDQLPHDGEPTAGKSGRFHLRPSALDKHAASLFKDTTTSPSRSSSGFRLEPPKLCSPLSSRFTDNNRSVPLTTTSADSVSSAADTTVTSTTDSVGVNSSADSCLCSQASSEPEFIFGQELESRVTTALLSSTAVTTSPTDSSSTQSEFVFGSNLADRVVMATPTAVTSSTESAVLETALSPDNRATPSSSEHSNITSETASHPTLAESAALQQARQSHVELEEVRVVTGEEDESNVFQVNVKLYVFDKKTQSWIELGLGPLRLNDRCLPSDSDSFQSRLVMRTQGNLRVVLNTMIWPNMLVERSSQKSIRISAVDANDGIKIYLIQTSASDADQIYSAISSRAQKLKSSTATTATNQPSPVSNEAALSTSSSITSVAEKRSNESVADNDLALAEKRRRVDVEPRRDQLGDESNDSSVADPETEASNEGFSSSPPIPSSSSEA